jgi:hypothetical protein
MDMERESKMKNEESRESRDRRRYFEAGAAFSARSTNWSEMELIQ